MWTVQRDYPEPAGSLEIRFLTGSTSFSYGDFLRALVDEPGFRDLLLDEMRSTPFTAFRWETPPVTTDTLDQPFACLFHDSPDLDVQANPIDFQGHFAPDRDIVIFNNLGGDALLVVPCPICGTTNYSHLGSFHRSAPRSQQHALWKTVGQAVLDRISPRPLWLSTAGGGVDWLHVRLDDRPKYYRHRPWAGSHR